jgi:hypothetical protein
LCHHDANKIKSSTARIDNTLNIGFTRHFFNGLV